MAFLQGQGDQISEPALGHRVLVGKQAIVRSESELARADAGVADDRRAEPTCIARGHRRCEEHPGMRSFARARDFQRRGHLQFLAGTHEGLRILTPIRPVEVHGEEMTGFILQQWVDADGDFPREVLMHDLVRDRQELPMEALRALDAWLLADAGLPFVGAAGAYPLLPDLPSQRRA